MKIAIIVGEVAFVSYQEFISGIRDGLKNTDCSIFLFTCEGWKYQADILYQIGEYNIFKLPDLKSYDGVIVDLNSIADSKSRYYLKKQLMSIDVPCVSINKPIGNSAVVKIENESGMRSVVRHLLEEHDVRDVFFISGPRHNYDAFEREKVFISEMKEHGIEVKRSNISYGDFDYEGGRREALKYLEKHDHLPDAFIVANDSMAIGVVQALQNAGYNVPNDVIVTGYDNTMQAEWISPTITTVHRGDYRAGAMAAKALLKYINSGEGDEHIIKGNLVIGESCGCKFCNPLIIKDIANRIINTTLTTNNNLEILKSLSVDFSNMDNYNEFCVNVKRHVEQLRFKRFYLCFCSSKEQYFDDIALQAAGESIPRDVTLYMDKAHISLAYEHGVWKSYPPFDTSQILPDEILEDGNAYYVILPVHSGECCIGYCVVENNEDDTDGRFIQHLVLNIDNALRSISKKDLMEAMLQRINEKWVYDELTGLYNRAGLWNNADNLIHTSRKNKSKVAVIFIDLDGLKRVNDEMGHEMGDKYIKSMGYILRKCRKNDELLVRYGGDEYVVVMKVDSEDAIMDYIQSIESNMSEYNENEARFNLSASIGYAIQGSEEDVSIVKLIDIADSCMYDVKKAKKR